MNEGEDGVMDVIAEGVMESILGLDNVLDGGDTLGLRPEVE